MDMLDLLHPTFAVHIPDGYLNRPFEGWPWLVGGYVGMAILGFWGTRRIRDEEIPRIALLTAAFTVASAFHISVGPSSVHLILNGLLGAVLGRRAALAIPVGLFLQALAGHGGFTTLGINSCIMLMPALLAAVVVRSPGALRMSRLRVVRSLQIGGSVFIWTMSLIFGVALALKHAADLASLQQGLEWSMSLLLPASAASAALALVAIVLAWRLGLPPEWSLGYLVGELAVLLSVGFSAMVMLAGGPANEGAVLFTLIFFIAHLPLAVAEGVVLGFLVVYLLRVKPEMIQRSQVKTLAAAPNGELGGTLAGEAREVEECASKSSG